MFCIHVLSFKSDLLHIITSMFFTSFTLISAELKQKKYLFFIICIFFLCFIIIMWNDYIVLQKITIYKWLFFVKLYNHSTVYLTYIYNYFDNINNVLFDSDLINMKYNNKIDTNSINFIQVITNIIPTISSNSYFYLYLTYLIIIKYSWILYYYLFYFLFFFFYFCKIKNFLFCISKKRKIVLFLCSALLFCNFILFFNYQFILILLNLYFNSNSIALFFFINFCIFCIHCYLYYIMFMTSLSLNKCIFFYSIFLKIKNTNPFLFFYFFVIIVIFLFITGNLILGCCIFFFMYFMIWLNVILYRFWILSLTIS